MALDSEWLCRPAVIVAAFAGTGSAKLLERLLLRGRLGVAAEPTVAQEPYPF